MNPGVACNGDIPEITTKVFPFKTDEDEKPVHTNILPGVNISETKEEYLIIMATPGLQRSDFKIEADQQIIVITARKEMNPAYNVTDRIEYDYTNWSRAFRLPADADVMFSSAIFRNGELVIHIPKNSSCENQAKVTIYVY